MKKQVMAVVVPMLVALGLFAPPPTSAGESQELLPNLRTLRFSTIDAVVQKTDASVLLRFNTNVLNRGKGPFELGPEGEQTCPDDGYIAQQRVYSDQPDGEGNYNGQYDLPTNESDGDHVNPRKKQVGCFKFHDAHNHWHFQDFADYALFKVKNDGTLRAQAHARADKISFCMLDTGKAPWQMKGQPPLDDRQYPPGGCKENDPENPNLENMLVSGISVGWYDSYPMSLPGQELDITQAGLGSYCLSVKLDPLQKLDETNDGDNERRVWVELFKNNKGQKDVLVRPYKKCPK